MKKSVFLNLFTVVPFAAWGYASVLMKRVLLDVAVPEQYLSLFLVCLMMYIIFLFYYILLISNLKFHLKDTSVYKSMSIVCLVVGTVFFVYLCV